MLFLSGVQWIPSPAISSGHYQQPQLPTRWDKYIISIISDLFSGSWFKCLKNGLFRLCQLTMFLLIWNMKFSSISDMSFFCFGIWKVYYSRYDTLSIPILCQRSKGGKVTFGKCPTWGIRVMVHSTFQRWKYWCKIAKIHFSNHCKLCGLLHFFLEVCKINCHIHSLLSSWNKAS